MIGYKCVRVIYREMTQPQILVYKIALAIYNEHILALQKGENTQFLSALIDFNLDISTQSYVYLNDRTLFGDFKRCLTYVHG